MNDNVYGNTSGPPKMIDSFVCYADILGYVQLSKEALNSGEGTDFLRRLRSALSAAYFNIRERLKSKRLRNFSMKVFTDNVVIGYPLYGPEYEQGEPEFAEVLSIFKELQFTLATQGFFLRGGIARGLHYMDDDIVFGDAFLEAVSLDKGGGPPRLTFTSSVIQTVQKQLSFYGGAEYAPQYKDILEDSDGEFYLDYLGEAFCAYPDMGIFFDLIDEHKQSIINGLIKYMAVPDVRAKYEWAARYHNFVCREFAELNPISIDPDADEYTASASVEAQKLLNHLIDVESLAAGPKRINLQPIRRGGH